MRASVLFAFFPVTCLLLGSAAGAQCTSSNRSSGQVVGYDGVQLVPQGIPGNLMGAFRTGYGAWNSCTGAGGAPSFAETWGSETGRQVVLQFFTGFNPDNPNSCGRLAGNNILLYSRARSADGTQTIVCDRADIFQDTVSHELGHLLGMLDQGTTGGCSSYIMSQVGIMSGGGYINRSIRSAECDMANDTNYTPIEQMEDLCRTDPDACESPQCEYPDYCSPIVLDYDGRGFEFTGLDRPVSFDIDSDGVLETTGWTRTSSHDAFVALDRNGNGMIDDASELFGDSTPMSNGYPAKNGYQALFELDVAGGNGNGFIDPGDLIYGRLLLWSDRNHNGISERRELLTLEQAGVQAIKVEYFVSLNRDEHGNRLRFYSDAYLVDKAGRSRKVKTVDVFFVKED
ncbi:MAG: hypothetical protein GY835_03425 [bacterium]|nr:hypothetical protein [bacterium]